MKYKIILRSSICIIYLTIPIFWYKLPAKIENLNRLEYCACGYSKVKFRNGNIYMVKYFHNSIKPGDCIGKYTVQNNNVDLILFSNNKQFTIHCLLDNIGLRTINTRELKAYNDNSYKIYLSRILNKL